MKILQVVHYFLPRHQAGTEIYTARLAQAQRDRGHEVVIFTSEDGRPVRGRFELQEDQWDGLPVFRLVRGEPPDFERSYLDPEIDRIFADFLAEHRPDVVHFQHTFRLSAGMLPVCEQAGIPAVITLADFWHICPPILLLRPGFERCPGPGPEACARCGNAIGALYAGAPGAALAGSENRVLRQSGKALNAGWDRLVRAGHALKRTLPQPLVDKLRALRQARELGDPASLFQKRLALVQARQNTMKLTLASARRVIAPSRFLRDRMIAADAVGPSQIIYSDYGFDPRPFAGLVRTASDHLRFGFIGTPVEHKGLHVAVAALGRLADSSAELSVYGDLTWFPAYARKLKRMAGSSRVRFQGRFEHENIASVLAGLDALIVPSLWYENSPLTIHEAFLAGVPVIVSDLGGMAELVENGGGRTFKAGDPDDLARVMRELIADPDLVTRLAAAIPAVKTVAANAEELEEIYVTSRPAQNNGEGLE